MVRQARCGGFGRAKAWRVMAGVVWIGEVSPGKARQASRGVFRQGSAWSGVARLSEAGTALCGWARRVQARSGPARRVVSRPG